VALLSSLRRCVDNCYGEYFDVRSPYFANVSFVIALPLSMCSSVPHSVQVYLPSSKQTHVAFQSTTWQQTQAITATLIDTRRRHIHHSLLHETHGDDTGSPENHDKSRQICSGTEAEAVDALTVKDTKAVRDWLASCEGVSLERRFVKMDG
jgi:hypothetical protein